ncbi:hypothetical protein IGI37_001103 [Enterococcus sp. AZ194]|uniref:hypothetical protein n=1 Tax=Enterococcus sp. AZ194 TaxID=2774629 RepID=UPI003F1E9941
MKKNNWTLFILIIFFVFGQFELATLPTRGFKAIFKDESFASLNSKKYFLQNNILWRLQEIPENASGIIEPGKKEVTYVYEKINIKSLKKKKNSLYSKENKVLSFQRKTSFGSNSHREETHAVSDLMRTLSGKILYGEYAGKKKTNSFF